MHPVRDRPVPSCHIVWQSMHWQQLVAAAVVPGAIPMACIAPWHTWRVWKLSLQSQVPEPRPANTAGVGGPCVAGTCLKHSAAPAFVWCDISRLRHAGGGVQRGQVKSGVIWRPQAAYACGVADLQHPVKLRISVSQLIDGMESHRMSAPEVCWGATSSSVCWCRVCSGAGVCFSGNVSSSGRGVCTAIIL